MPGASPETQPLLARLADHAIAYYRDFVRPEKRYRQPTEMERAALEDLAATLAALPDNSAETIQNAVFEVGKRHPFPDLRTWFGCLYQVLLGQQEGPRFGGFVALYGIPETIALIHSALARQSGCGLTHGGRQARNALKPWVRHLPAILGVALLIGAIYVVQREFRHLRLKDIGEALAAIPVTRWCSPSSGRSSPTSS